MKLTKRLAALALCLCLLCGIPLSVSAADDLITLDKAVLISTTDTQATFEVTFSDYVYIYGNGGLNLMSQGANAGCNQSTTYQSWTPSIVASNDIDTTVTDGVRYSKRFQLTFYKCRTCFNAGRDANETHGMIWGEDGNTLPANAWISIQDNTSPNAATGVISTSKIVGSKGQAVAAPNFGAGHNYAAIKPVQAITLDEAAVTKIDDNGITVRATFSDKVSVYKATNAFWLYDSQTNVGGNVAANCQIWKHSEIVYGSDATVDNGVTYSSEMTMTFPFCGLADHDNRWKDENGNYKMAEETMYLFMEDNKDAGCTHDMSTFATGRLVGLDGAPVLKTANTNWNSNTIAVALTYDPAPEPELIVYPTLDKVEFTGDPAILDGDYGVVYTVRLTFNKPVHFGGSWELTGNENGGNFQSWTSLMGTNYRTPIHENPIYKDGDQTTAYSDTVLLHVTVRDYLASNANATADRFLTYLDSLGIRVTDATIDGGIQTIYDMDGNTVRATSNNNVNQERLFITGTDNTAKIGTVVLGENVTMSGSYSVPAGMTLDLNGNTFTADSIYVAGCLSDRTQGDGLVVAQDGMTYAPAAVDCGVMPLYDSAAQGYRLFDVTIKHATKTVDGAVKFGTALVLGGDEFNTKAYTLLQDPTNANVSLTFELSIDGDEPIYYDVIADVLTEYADRLLADNNKLNTTAIVLTVFGIEKMTDGMTLDCTPTLTSGTLAVAAGNTLRYTA